MERSSLVCFWGACVPVYWLAGCLLAGVGLQRHGLVGFSGMDNVGKRSNTTFAINSTIHNQTVQCGVAMRQISANQDYQTSASPSRSMTQVREKKKHKKCEKKATESSCFWDQKSVPKMGPTFFSLLKS